MINVGYLIMDAVQMRVTGYVFMKISGGWVHFHGSNAAAIVLLSPFPIGSTLKGKNLLL